MFGNQEQDEQQGPHSNYHSINSLNNLNLCNATAWNELSVAAATAANAQESNSFSQAIELSSTAIQLLSKQLINLLEIRANAWSKTGNIIKQLEDALNMTYVAPNCPSGYLYAGTLYINLGYQARAIQILEKGLAKASQHDPQYTLLQHHYEKACMQLERRADFIARCPYEIVLTIIEKLSNFDLYKCTCVSRSWRQVIIRNYSRWQTFGVDGYKLNSSKLLPLVAPYIQTLNVVWSTQTSIGKLLGFIQRNQFPQLQSLRIGLRSSYAFVGSPTNYNSIIYKGVSSILPIIGVTLTSLVFRGVDNLPPLVVILLACPKLSVFDHDRPNLFPWFNGLSSSISYMTQLTKIRLCFRDYDEKNMPTEEMTVLIRHSPALEHIFLDGCSCYDMLPIIYEYCSNLEQLWLNLSRMIDNITVTYPVEYYDGENNTIKNDNIAASSASGNSRGLKCLLLCGHFPADGSIISRLIEKSCDSLHTLYICPKSPPTITAPTSAPTPTQLSVDWEDSMVSMTCTMAALTTLHIEQKIQTEEPTTTVRNDTVTRLIEQSPNLKSLTLSHFKNQEGITNSMVDAMARLKSLEDLKLEESAIPIGSHLCLPINSYNCNNFSALRYISIIHCPGQSDLLLHHIARIKTLQDIRIENSFDSAETTAPGLAKFTRLLAQLPCLKELILYGFELDDETVHSLASSKSLNHVEFSDDMVSEEVKEYLRTHGIPLVY